MNVHRTPVPTAVVADDEPRLAAFLVERLRALWPELAIAGVAANGPEAQALIADVTRGAMADVCVVSTDVAEGAYVAQALSLVGKRGRVVMTAIPHPTDMQVDMSLFDLTLYEKQVRGSLFGSSSPRRDIPRLLDLHSAGQLKLDELVTREYTLDEINQGYADMHAGVNLRGLIRF